jgi:hypothetical protein
MANYCDESCQLAFTLLVFVGNLTLLTFMVLWSSSSLIRTMKRAQRIWDRSEDALYRLEKALSSLTGKPEPLASRDARTSFDPDWDEWDPETGGPVNRLR